VYTVSLTVSAHRRPSTEDGSGVQQSNMCVHV